MQTKTYCPGCNLTVAPHDPQKLVVKGDTWHRACWDALSNWAQAILLRRTAS